MDDVAGNEGCRGGRGGVVQIVPVYGSEKRVGADDGVVNTAVRADAKALAGVGHNESAHQLLREWREIRREREDDGICDDELKS